MVSADTLASEKMALEARKIILRLAFQAQTSHVASALSVVDIIAAVYQHSRPHLAKWRCWESKDIVLLSKGHAAMAMYAVLNLIGIIPRSFLDSFGKNGATLAGHVTHGVPGIEFSTGSLGHGLPVGVGIALRRKRLKREGRVIVIMSDGELDEGTTWESCLLANHHALGNLLVFVDRNRLQSMADTEKTLSLDPLDEKFRAFGWNVRVVEGHSHMEIQQILREEPTPEPQVVICENTKGKGVSFMENQVVWHYRPPSEEDYQKAVTELSRA